MSDRRGQGGALTRPPSAILWWQRAVFRTRFQFGPRDLSALSQVKTPARLPIGESMGDTSHHHIRHPISAGWYMAEVQVNTPAGHASVSFCVAVVGSPASEAVLSLPIRSGQISKRLLYLPAAANVRIHLASGGLPHEMKHFRLVRMSEPAARKRMLHKLKRQHPGHRSSPAGVLKAPELWRDYDSLFRLSALEHISYPHWIQAVESPQIPPREVQRRLAATWSHKPLVSIIVPTFDTDTDHLQSCLDSVLQQTYPHWELCVADDASTNPEIRRVLERYAARDQRIRLAFRASNGRAAAASSTALALATGSFVALLDHDDELVPHALFFMVEALQRHPDAQILYSDEDKLDENGNRCDAFCKPDFSPDLLYSQNYICHFTVYRRTLLIDAGGFRDGFDGSQDYDLILRCLQHVRAADNIVHVPRILYHWRKTAGSTASDFSNKAYATESGRRALQEHLDQSHPGAKALVAGPGLYRVRWPLAMPEPLVSLIIPTRDGYEHLRTCIESILERTAYSRYEILVVDNQSTCAQTLAYIDSLVDQDGNARGADAPRVRVLRFDAPFNYSAINNMAARHASGSILGLINNDIEVINAEWLSEMVSHAVRPDIGCVGAKLYYPDGTIQHAGVVLGIGGVAGHPHKHLPGHADGYFGRLRTICNVSAVTGAALLLRKSVFEQVGALDAQGLHVAFNDVDLCLKVRTAGYRNLWTPHAELVHHESKSRGADDTPQKQARFMQESQLMIDRWGPLLHTDPYYNPNLTLAYEDCSLGHGDAALRGQSQLLVA